MGFNVVPAEPDLRAQIGLEEAAFAAKRLRSVRKLHQNLRSAGKQLAVHGIPGFVVVDLSFVNRIEKPIYVPELRQQQAIVAVMLDGFAHEHEHEIFDAAKQPFVRDVILHASVVGRSVEPLARFASRRWLLCANQPSEVANIMAAVLQRLVAHPANAR